MHIDDYASDWVSAEHTVVSKVLPPPDMIAFDVRRLSDGTREYTWDLGTEPPEVAGVLIRSGPVGSAWAALTPLTASPVEVASPWQSELPPTGGLRRYAAKMVDTSGNESPNMLWVRMLICEGLSDSEREQVHVGTVHALKGREADVVVVLDAVERRFSGAPATWSAANPL